MTLKKILSISIIGLSLVFSYCSILENESNDADLQNILLIILATRPPNSVSSTLTGEALEFQKLVNDHRTNNTSCASFQELPVLNQNALKHSQDMANRNFFDHTNPDGKSPFDRMRDDGIRYDTAGENIAKGQKTGQSVLTAWLNSSGHKRNIENCRFTHHGIGLHEGTTTHWTHVFAGNPRTE